ncbi:MULTISPECIES: hypothetical protein [unclassified Nocardioides]|uniref:hypothetical protein n=1 Tax=unclassified Nocardioides TaxID=2615069 RepID=UPI000056FF1A|nr:MULTISPECIES: hypothetical protein [unclassified Nocardioides]ABL83865.1 hypothetical protein Noca_4368 [Nocardioides sp. JS614]
MSEQPPERPDERHPIATGLVALVGVAVVVGLIMGLVVVAGASVLGVGGGGTGAGTGSERSMYLPRPEKTPAATGPEITLAPGASTPVSSGPATEPTRSKSARKQITLSASVTSAGPMETFDLTGVYPGGEGAILQVQRFTGGSWRDFPVTASVSDETFQTSVATSYSGPNRFRVVDTDTGLESNEIRVTIG